MVEPGNFLCRYRRPIGRRHNAPSGWLNGAEKAIALRAAAIDNDGLAVSLNEQRSAVKPSVALSLHRGAVRAAAARFRSANPRVFGSALSGADKEGSDLDILVDPLPGATLFDLGALQVELMDILGVPVDLLTPGDLPPKVRAKVLAEARPV